MEVFCIANKDMFINEQIRAKEVMVIGPNGEQLGVKGIQDALTLANFAGFDLVLMNPNGNPPVCKIMDYNKFKYENKKRAKENIKKQKEANLEMKEYRLTVPFLLDCSMKLKDVGIDVNKVESIDELAEAIWQSK